MSDQWPKSVVYDRLAVQVYPDNAALGRAAAESAATILREAITARGVANLILATGNSQLTFLHALRTLAGIDWPAVNVFHMDEYLHLPPGHPATFSLFLRRHVLDQVPYGTFYPVPGSPANVEQAREAYDVLLHAFPADLCCCGIGENGHLAFNEPSVADFADPVWVKVISLEEASRRQQVGEGHFPSLDSVPTHALTLTIPALLAARQVLCLVPERRKAGAVERTLRGPIGHACPASILRQTAHARLFLDQESAAHLATA
jgi:glucosamine-6-phosphate deaminase